MKISNIRLVSIVIVTLIFGVSCSEGPREISLEQLQQRSDGLYYAVNEDKPFSGVAVETYEDGQKSAEKSFEDGKLHGFIRAWYPDGNKKSEIGYDDGLQSGPFRTWYDNGQQEMEGDYKDGRRTGEWSFWNRDGQKLEAGKVTDIDGNTYLTIKIGDQWWMAENLKVTHYRNGEPIVHVTADSAWRRLSSGAYCSYGNDEDRADVYGRLYNYYAVADGRGIAPEGWHVPGDAEWQALIDYLGSDTNAGGGLKETGTTHWQTPNTGATNVSAFNALPGGYRDYDGPFYSLGYFAYFWSSAERLSYFAWYRGLHYFSSEIHRGFSIFLNKQFGFSVRCVRD